MYKAFDEIRLFLFTCSGEDNYILKKCSKQIQARFALLGFFVLVIFVGCFLSATFFIASLFDGVKWIGIPMGIIWGAVIVNLYLLLLHTISPAIIPLSSKKKKGNKDADIETTNNFFSPSMLFRIIFMALLAVITAQPLNVFFLSDTVQGDIEQHKIEERVKLYTLSNEILIQKELLNLKEFDQKVIQQSNIFEVENTTNSLIFIDRKIKNDQTFVTFVAKKIKQLDKINEHLFLTAKEKINRNKIVSELEIQLNNELDSDRTFVDNLNSIEISGKLKKEYDTFKSNLTDLILKKIDNYDTLNNLLNKSNFYIKTIQVLLTENPASWVLTLFVCLLFLSPICIKYYVRNLSARIFKKEESNHPGIIRLREELIHTKDFHWLENKIKNTNIEKIHTSDYYFQRMLIEHKIILEEYEDCKKQFSEILSTKIKKYNTNSLSRLIPLLEKLKKVDINKYNDYSTAIFHEYRDEIMIKYEYWLDMPFRTKRIRTAVISNNEKALLDFVYDQNTEPQES